MSNLSAVPLIVSYSYSGNTHQIARGIQAATGGDRCEIHPWQPYPTAFPELLEQVKRGGGKPPQAAARRLFSPSLRRDLCRCAHLVRNHCAAAGCVAVPE